MKKSLRLTLELAAALGASCLIGYTVYDTNQAASTINVKVPEELASIQRSDVVDYKILENMVTNTHLRPPYHPRVIKK